jgi:hypothetical protein
MQIIGNLRRYDFIHYGKPKRIFIDLYRNFNNRNIEYVISRMIPDVAWANGMDGGFVHMATTVYETTGRGNFRW